MSTYKDIIKQIRTDKGLTQAELAEKTGMSQAYIQSLESGRIKTPGIDFVAALANELQVNPYVFIREGEPFYVPVVKAGQDPLQKKVIKYEQLIQKLHEAMVS